MRSTAKHMRDIITAKQKPAHLSGKAGQHIYRDMRSVPSARPMYKSFFSTYQTACRACWQRRLHPRPRSTRTRIAASNFEMCKLSNVLSMPFALFFVSRNARDTQIVLARVERKKSRCYRSHRFCDLKTLPRVPSALCRTSAAAVSKKATAVALKLVIYTSNFCKL